MKSLIAKVKSSALLYWLYYNFGSFFVCVLKLFIKPDNKLILFNSFGGKKYDDSPKAIYEKMLNDPRFSDFHFVWAFHNPENFEVFGCEKIKTDTIKYYITALKAKIWVTNSGIERGLSFKGKNTVYFNTWHGTPIKKMGTDIKDDNKSFKSKSKNKTDFMNAQSDFEAEIFSRVFNINIEKFLKFGLPRNDRLTQITENERKDLRKSLGIKENSKVILYAPTFREYNRDKNGKCEITFPFDIKNLKQNNNSHFVVLFRAHYEVSKFMNIPKNDDNIIDVSSYPCLDDLIIASDILISDYSSIIFDYSITGKPIFLFTYDYKEYAEKRGVYFDIRNYFTDISNNDVFSFISSFNDENERSKTDAFRQKYVQYYGNATQKTIDAIYDVLK